MGLHVIKMPDIGEGIAEVELVAWRVKPGDVVAEDQVLADVMTDKATVEIPSPVLGTVISLGGEVGRVMAVGSELIRIEVEGGGNVAAAPSTVAVRTEPPLRAPAGKPLASPSVRQQARGLGIELNLVPGSGPEGRVTHEDVETYAARRPGAASAGSDARYAERNSEQAIPLVGVRRKIAQKMQEASQRIPHFTYVEEIDVTELEALRAQLNARWESTRGHLTPLPLMARAIVLAVREFPQINARFDDAAGVVTRYGAVHLGIATQTEIGLMVPVLRHAETLDLWGSAAQIARLAHAARTAKATRDELSGSTITITSLGALGGIVSTPIINHPEVAIVGINRIALRPMVRGGVVLPRLMMNLSSSFDHRVIDGAHAAEFVQALRGFLECPATLFVE